ncbi:cytochrome P450 4C1-like [Macrosteles quadrilineatus]|uniref:cytochrome P450 4C1-like n=1 Tax=Macrosteles quadrilineatus TaxID=74068 RepID=UPI0023E0D366|nr:cytochrome P450 4C1-like [Macrosteles quadrilineatus]
MSTLQLAMLALLATTAATKVLAYCGVLTVGLWLWFQWTKWDLLQEARKLPCTVKTLPIVGHTHLLFRTWEDTTKLALERFSKAAVSTGVYNICAWCGPLPIVMIHKLEDIQKILVSCLPEKGNETEYLKYATGNGLITAPYCIWKVTGRNIGPLFHPPNIQQLITIFNSNSRQFVTLLGKHERGHSVNVLEPCMGVALQSVYQLIFGTDESMNESEVKEMLKAVQDVTELFMKRIVRPWLRVDFIFKFLYRKELKKINHGMRAFVEIPLKRARFKSNQASHNPTDLKEKDVSAFKGCLSLIDVYTELQKKYPQFTDEDLKYEMATFYGTGTDTVGVTIATCLQLLGKYHEIQDRLYAEITHTVGSSDDVTKEHLQSMTYLDQVFKETLRWATVVPYILRKTTEAVKLSDCTIPAGNSVVICLIGPLKDPNIYPDPEQFNPDRFSPNNSSSPNRDAFIPFGTGRRMCIGKTYSDHLVKIILVHILRRFRVTTDMDIYNVKKSLAITLVNTEGYYVKLHDRS